MMEVYLKNVILYDAEGNVSGFAEFKSRTDFTAVKVRHNYGDTDLLFSIVAGGEQTFVVQLGGVQTQFKLNARLELEDEIFCCIIKKHSEEVITLASGIINAARRNIIKRAQHASELRREIDEKYEDIERESASIEIAETQFSQENAQHKEINGQEFESEKENKKSDSSNKAEILEIDKMLRVACTIDDQGKGVCENCPYREHFFGKDVLAEKDKEDRILLTN